MTSLPAQSDYEQELLQKLKAHDKKDTLYFEYFLDYADFLADHHAPSADSIIKQLQTLSKKEKQWKYLIKSTPLLTSPNQQEKLTLLEDLFSYPEIRADTILTALLNTGIARYTQRYGDSNSIQEARQLAYQSYETLIKNNPKSAFHAKGVLAHSYYLEENYQEALKQAQALNNLAQEIGDSTFIGNSLVVIAVFSQVYGDLPKAMEASLEAISYLKDGKDDSNLCYLYRTLCSIAYDDDNQEKVLLYAAKAYEYAKKLKSPYWEVVSLINLATGYLNNEQIEKADSIAGLLPPLLKENDFSQEYVSYSIVKGGILRAQEKNKEALLLYSNTLHFIDSTGAELSKPWILEAMTELMRKEGLSADLQSSELLGYFEQENEQKRGIYDKVDIAAALKNIFLLEKNYEKAFEFSEIQADLQSQLMEINAQANLEEQILKLDNEAKATKIAFQEERIQRQKTVQSLLVALVMVALIFIASLFYFLKKQVTTTKQIKSQRNQLLSNQTKINGLLKEVKEKNNKISEKNELLNQQLQIRQQELADNMVFRSSRNYEIQKLVKQMDEFIKKGKIETVDLKTLRTKHHQLIMEEEQFDIKRRIETLYPNFYENLKLKHPNLTKGDLNHCAYMLINLSSKQVADLHHVSVRTVESGRYRAKQKMNIGHDVNLKEYLLSST